MPKREPTPPLEEGSTFLIVNYPYPYFANMNIKSDRYVFAQWIVACIGRQYQRDFVAIYYKTRVNENMVIIEISKDCPKIDALLGAHKWSEFLKRPNPQEVTMTSRIYYCRYSNYREVDKYQWKQLNVDDRWFDDYDPINGPFITNPYPTAGFCEVPPESQVDYRLCRPLPVALFPRSKPSAKRPIVPGSDVYVSVKQAGGQPMPVSAPTPTKQTTKSWASIASTRVSRANSGGEWRQATSSTWSTGPHSTVSLTNGHDTNNAIEPPPGLSMKPSQERIDWEFEPSSAITHSDSSELPEVEIITSGLAAAAIKDHIKKTNTTQTSSEQDEDEKAAQEDYWAELPVRPTDWDKPICPEHQIYCPGICKTMSEIKKKMKREAAKASTGWNKESGNKGGNEDSEWNNGDGWEIAKPKGRGRGRGRGRGQSRGRGARGRVGGWC